MRQAIGLIILFLLLLLPAVAEPQPDLKIGSPAPTSSLFDFSEKTEVVILSFFASWSKSCQEELLFLNDLAKDKRITVQGISYDRKAAELEKFISDHKITFAIARDKKLTTLKDFRILIIPTLIVIDPDSNVASIYVDFDDNVKEALRSKVTELLNPKK